jgi:hypothetical protein
MSTIESLNQMRSDFVRLAEAAELPTSPPRSRRRPRLRAFAVAAAAACAAGAGAILVTTTGGGSTRDAGGTGTTTGILHAQGSIVGVPGLEGRPLPKLGRDPFGEGGRRVSLAEAIAEAGYAFPVPAAPAANHHKLSYVWISRGGAIHEVALQYASTGVRVFIKPALPTFKQDPRRQFETMARELHLGRNAVHTIGRGVLFVQTKPGLSGGPSVEMIYPDAGRQLEIDIIGSPSTSIADLTAVARSMSGDSR